MQTQNFGGFNIEVTPLVKKTLITLVSLYIGQIVLTNWMHFPLEQWLYIWPLDSGAWRPWQLVTALLFNHVGSPLTACIDWLVLYFFMGSVERLMGTRGLIKAVGFSLAFAVLTTTGLDAIGALVPQTPYVGLNPLLMALLVFFGLLQPNAKILLFFVLPIKASWVAWASGFIIALYFLAFRDLSSSMSLGGWGGAWLWLQHSQGGGPLHWWSRHQKMRKLERDLGRFTVHPGGKSDDEYIH